MRAEWKTDPIVLGGASCKSRCHTIMFSECGGCGCGCWRFGRGSELDFNNLTFNTMGTIATLASGIFFAHNAKQSLTFFLPQIQSFSYGTKVQHLSSSEDPFSYDLYQNTTENDSEDDDEMAPPSHFIPRKNPKLVANMGPRNLLFPSKLPVAKPTFRTAAQTKVAGAAGEDPALAQLTSATADIEKKKQANTYVCAIT